MAPKKLVVITPNGDQRTISVVGTTRVREIAELCHEDDGRDREAQLLRGETLLDSEMTVSQAGLEDGDEISLVWSDLLLKWPAGEVRR